jgi:hypothetical protein
MAVDGGTLQRATAMARVPRWRVIALSVAIVGTVWATGFATGRMTTASPVVRVVHSSDSSLPEFIRPGKDRGQVKFGTASGVEPSAQIRPGNHGGGTVKGG